MEVIKSGTIKKAAVDVYPKEPRRGQLDWENPYADCEEVVVLNCHYAVPFSSSTVHVSRWTIGAERLSKAIPFADSDLPFIRKVSILAVEACCAVDSLISKPNGCISILDSMISFPSKPPLK